MFTISCASRARDEGCKGTLDDRIMAVDDGQNVNVDGRPLRNGARYRARVLARRAYLRAAADRQFWMVPSEWKMPRPLA